MACKVDTQPKGVATGEPTFDITMYDSKGEWTGSAGQFPLSWIQPTDEAPDWFKESWRETENIS
jgi:hypothetical protein